MLDTVIGLVGKVAIGKKALAALHGLNAGLSGHRTQILVGLEALLYLLKKSGVVPPEAVEPINALMTVLLGAIPVTLAEKVSRVQKIADKIVPDQKPIEPASEQKPEVPPAA